MEKATWRLIEHPAASGAWNMAVDEAVLESVGCGAAIPTLRLYRWNPPCLSLGYAQPFTDVDCSAITANGWQVVRRPTGGRAILHTDELTYSVILPSGEPRAAGSVLESYQRLSQALLAALRSLGLPAQASESYSQSATIPGNLAVRFERPSNYEITVAGKKLIGSAQSRRSEGILQHGSLPLQGDLTRITRALSFEDELARNNAAARLLERAATVENVLDSRVSWDAAAAAFTDAFASALNLELVRDTLTAAEEYRAAALQTEKYDSPIWTERV